MGLMPVASHSYSPVNSVVAGDKENSKDESVSIKPSVEDRVTSFAEVRLSENGVERVLTGDEAFNFIASSLMSEVVMANIFLMAMTSMFSDPYMLAYFEEKEGAESTPLQPNDKVEELETLSLAAEKPLEAQKSLEAIKV